jgi:hypothetical protein
MIAWGQAMFKCGDVWCVQNYTYIYTHQMTNIIQFWYNFTCFKPKYVHLWNYRNLEPNYQKGSKNATNRHMARPCLVRHDRANQNLHGQNFKRSKPTRAEVKARPCHVRHGRVRSINSVRSGYCSRQMPELCNCRKARPCLSDPRPCHTWKLAELVGKTRSDPFWWKTQKGTAVTFKGTTVPRQNCL